MKKKAEGRKEKNKTAKSVVKVNRSGRNTVRNRTVCVLKRTLERQNSIISNILYSLMYIYS